MPESTKPFPYAVSGLSATIGRVLSIDDFARSLAIPDRKHPGEILRGDFLRELFGLESKSWDPDRFQRPETLVDTTRLAIDRAGLTPSDIDVLALITCTPLWPNLDRDAFAIAERLRLPSPVTVWQVNAGCAGLARVLHAIADLPYRNVVTLLYNLASPFMLGDDGALNPLYASPLNKNWFSAALFADGAAAAVWSRRARAEGLVTYARESGDPLIHFTGGGAWHPPGRSGAAEEMTYAIATGEAADYYREGMARNHRSLDDNRPGWLQECARYYLHQTGASAVQAHYQRFAVPETKRHCHAHRYGNMSSPATLVMLAEDIRAGAIAPDARVALSTVGAGPERGAAIFPLQLEDRR